MSLKNPKLIKASTHSAYSRWNKNIQENPHDQYNINEKCPLCNDNNLKKKIFHSLNSLYGHLLSHHRVVQIVFESDDDFKIRKSKEFDFRKYIESLAENLLKEFSKRRENNELH